MSISVESRTTTVVLVASVVFVKLLIVLALVPYFSELFPKLYQINLFPDGYEKIATNLIEGRGYRIYPETGETMMRLPGYVFVLAALFLGFGKKIAVVQLVNIALSFGTAYFVVQIGKRFLNYTREAYLAALLFLFYPGTILAESRGGVECLYTLLMTVFVYWLYKALDGDRKTDYLAAGVFLGASVIVKSSTLLMPGFFFLYLAFTKGRTLGMRHVLVSTLLIALPVLFALSPWVVRNYTLTGEFVLTQTNLGSTAYQGMRVNDNVFSKKDHKVVIREAVKDLNSRAKEMNLSFKEGFFQHFYDAKDEVYFNRYVFGIVMTKYFESPSLLIKNSILNFFRFWFQGRTWKSSVLNILIVLPLLIFVSVGIYKGIKYRIKIAPILFFVIVFVAGHLPILTTARYHVPLIPLLSLVAFASAAAGKKRDILAKNSLDDLATKP